LRYRRNFLVKFPPAAERFVERDIRNHDSKPSDRILFFKFVLLSRGIQDVKEIRYPMFVARGVKIQRASARVHGLAEMLGGSSSDR
jgi:hypothetical protein